LLRIGASFFLDSDPFIQLIESFAWVTASFMQLGMSLPLYGVPFVRGREPFPATASRMAPGDASSRRGGVPFHR
jgi:hypothetical protein